MPTPKGIEWNQLQLKIAKMLIEDEMTPTQIAATGLCSYQTAYKVKQRILKGETPPSLDPDFIAQAPPPSEIPKEPLKPKADKQAPATKDEKKLIKQKAFTTTAVSETALLQLIPQVQQLPLTPDIFMSYMAALKTGYEGTLANWLSLVSRDFWWGREINFYALVSGIGAEEEGEEVLVGDKAG